LHLRNATTKRKNFAFQVGRERKISLHIKYETCH
jgi:hypothetical protein